MSNQPNIKPPKILTDSGLSLFVTNDEYLWKLTENLPTTDVNLKELIWHFDMPVWEKDYTDDWNLTPWQVIHKEDNTLDHQEKIKKSDLSFPIIITNYQDKSVILDGVHRLAKAYLEGRKTIEVKNISYEILKLR